MMPGYVVGHVPRGFRIRPLRVFEHEGELVAHLAHQRQRVAVLLLGLGAESRDQVGRDRAVGQDTSDRPDPAEVPLARVLAVHQFQYPGVARLGG